MLVAIKRFSVSIYLLAKLTLKSRENVRSLSWAHVELFLFSCCDVNTAIEKNMVK